MKQTLKKMGRVALAASFIFGSGLAFTSSANAAPLGVKTAGLTDTVGKVVKKRGPQGMHCGGRFSTEYNYDAVGNVKCYVHNSELACKNGYAFEQASSGRSFKRDGDAFKAAYRCVGNSASVSTASDSGKKSCRRGFRKTDAAPDGSYNCVAKTLDCPKGFEPVKGDVYPAGFAYFCHRS